MTLPDSIYEYLAALDSIKDLVGDDIYYVDTERQNREKAIFFEDVGDARLRAFRVSPALSSTRISFECWADLQSDAEAIAEAVYAAFCDPNGDGSGVFTGALCTDGITVQDIRFEDSRALRDDQAKKYGREIDLTFDYAL